MLQYTLFRNYDCMFANVWKHTHLIHHRLHRSFFIPTAVSACNAVAYTISPIFMHIDVTLIFDDTPLIIAQRCHIVAPRWSNDISSAADNAIFKNKAQNIEFSFGCVARSGVLLKPNVANILLFKFCEQKFIQHGLITIVIDYNGHSLLIFEENKAQLCLWSKIRTKHWLVLDASAFHKQKYKNFK